MLPQETIDLLKEEMSLNHAPLHETRAYSSLLNNVNSFSKEELNEFKFNRFQILWRISYLIGLLIM